MKIYINENERGFVFKHGKFVRMLLPGRHRIMGALGERVQKIKAEGRFIPQEYDISIYMKDKQFSESVTMIDVPDGHFAIRFEDGKVAGILNPGKYYFWHLFKSQEYKLIDTGKPEINEIPLSLLASVPGNTYIKIMVPEGKCALLYFDGRYNQTLQSGCYYFWKGLVEIAYQMVDLRTQQMDVTGQEILTADKVSLRLNFVCSYKIVDPVKIVSEIDNYAAQIHHTVQLVLREYVGRFKFDELLEQKENIAGFVLEKLKDIQGQFHLQFIDAGVKDIVLPGEIRAIMNTVLVAEKTAQANVIARREEVASTRSLLNTAKLLDENTTLYKLKEMEYLERICEKVGNISLGSNNVLGELRELITR